MRIIHLLYMAQTRKQRILADTKKHRQRRALTTVILAAVLIAIIGVGVYFATRPGPSQDWPYPCLGQETLAFHIHPWLRIWINNANVTIPAAVGISNPVYQGAFATGGPNSCFEPVHTHDSSGIIHVEAPDSLTPYTLGAFFQIWKISFSTVNVNGANYPVVFNRTDILGFRTDSTHTLTLLVDGKSSSFYDSLSLNQYDYCDSTVGSVPPCSPTAPGDPYPASYPYGTKHTIIIQYKTIG